MAIYTYQDIIHGKFRPMAWEAFSVHYTIDEIETGELPLIRFRWLPREAAYISEKEAKQLANKGLGILPADRPTLGKEFVVWGAKVLHNGDLSVCTRWFCNYRRYGWAWTKEAYDSPKYEGVIYANRDFIGLYQETPEQVIRETLLVAIAKLDVPSELKYHVKMHRLWRNLLDDAILHKTKYAEDALCGLIGGTAECTINGQVFKP